MDLTGLRPPCVLINRFQSGLKRQVLSSAETGPPFKRGVLGLVRAAGTVAAGDTARVRLPSSSFRALPGLKGVQEAFRPPRCAALAQPPGCRSGPRGGKIRDRDLRAARRLARSANRPLVARPPCRACLLKSLDAKHSVRARLPQSRQLRRAHRFGQTPLSKRQTGVNEGQNYSPKDCSLSSR